MAHVYQFYEDSEHTEAFIVASYKKYNVVSSKVQWAAIILQAFFKMIYVRQQIKKWNKAATVIQKYVRGWLVRYRLPDIMHEYYDIVCLKKYNDAAIKIQARWKGFIVRMYDICIKDIIKMREITTKANENMKNLFKKPFSEMGLDDFQNNTKYARRVFKVLLDRHHLLSTNQIKGVLSQQGKEELSELEKLLKLIPWKNYMAKIHKIFHKNYIKKPPYKYKYTDKRLMKQEDLLRESKYAYDYDDNINPASYYYLKEKGFILTTKIENRPYERLLSTSGKYEKPIRNIARTCDPSKYIGETDFDLGVLRDLALESKIPPYYINFWFEKCPCTQTHFQ